MQHASGFIYYVAIAGITGARSAAADVTAAVNRLRRFSELPIAVGFGIRTQDQAAAVARAADAPLSALPSSSASPSTSTPTIPPNPGSSTPFLPMCAR
jgi:Tryptophan synthase alpha chain